MSTNTTLFFCTEVLVLPDILGSTCPKRQLSAYSAAPAGLFHFIILIHSLSLFYH